MIDLHAGAQVLEDVPPQHAAEAQAKPVIEPDRRTVEHLPEPEQRLAAVVALAVDLGIMLRLESDVFRIEGELEHAARKLRGERGFRFSAAGPAQVKLMKLLANNFRTSLRRAVPHKFIIEELYPAAIDFLRLRRRVGCGVRGVLRGFHTDGRYTRRVAPIEPRP